jgi:predicted P-loop ATPase
VAFQPETHGLAPPEPSQRFSGATRRLGQPVRDFLYTDTNGQVLMHVCRYPRKESDDAPAETDSPFTTLWWLWEDHEWVEHRGAPEHAPLYRAERLWRAPAVQAYLCDSEEDADALQALLDDSASPAIATCWAGGHPAVKRQDWALLHERDVVLWPRAGKPALMDMVSISEVLWPAIQRNGGSVEIVRAHGLPPDWTLAKAVEDGSTWNNLQEHLIANLGSVQQAQVVQLPPPPPKLTVIRTEAPPPAESKLAGSTIAARWREYGLSCATNGTPHANLYNVVRVIEFHKGAYVDVWLDEFHNRIMTRETASSAAREWNEADTLEFTRFIQSPQGVNLPSIKSSTVHDAAVLCASKCRRNEVREWLRSLQWDGVERLNDAMPTGWGTPNHAYFRAVGRCFIMGAAARILQPGCQVDNLPVFEGAEGIFKTTALIKLASEAWFDSPTYALGDHDFYQSLPGKWILEFAEMSNLNGRTGDLVRAVITRRVDNYRPSYGRLTVAHPRMCVFSATTNEKDWNRSLTGARRFWPVPCGRINLGWIESNRDQLFAEAVHRVDAGEPWHDVPREEARAAQNERMPLDVWHNSIVRYVDGRKFVVIDDVLRHGLFIEDRSRWTAQVRARIAFALTHLGWLEVSKPIDGAMTRCWEPQQKTAVPDPENQPPW